MYCMNNNFVKRIGVELEEIKGAGLFKNERIISSEQGAEIIVNGTTVLNFCANNYLGLSSHPKVIEKELKFSIFKKHNNDVLLFGDAVRTYQVLLNLASNAIKFTNTGGVKITVSVKHESDNFINVICCD